MKIVDVWFAKGRTGFFFDDQKAIKSHAVQDGAAYFGDPLTPGFTRIRQAGEAVSVMLLLEDGQMAWGDCAAVQYSGAGGRDPLFLAEDFIPILEERVRPWLLHKEMDSFRGLSSDLERAFEPALHHAIIYGVSQALLDGVAKAHKEIMCQTVAREYALTPQWGEIPIFTQSGDNRYENVDKMILKEAAVLPHGLINNEATKLGHRGELLLEYVLWLKQRILQLRQREDYLPVLHIDVYGTLGGAFAMDTGRMADYLETLAEAARPLTLRIEGPMDAGSRQAQIQALSALREAVDQRGIAVELVADEWCNTLEDICLFADAQAGHMIQIKTPDLGALHNIVEAVLYCKAKGIGAYQGGTCNETDRSAQVCVHLAMAAQPDQMLAKPGMGVDEGFMVVYNEMQRIKATLKHREGR